MDFEAASNRLRKFLAQLLRPTQLELSLEISWPMRLGRKSPISTGKTCPGHPFGEHPPHIYCHFVQGNVSNIPSWFAHRPKLRTDDQTQATTFTRWKPESNRDAPLCLLDCRLKKDPSEPLDELAKSKSEQTIDFDLLNLVSTTSDSRPNIPNYRLEKVLGSGGIRQSLSRETHE